ncbi:MAG: hypothetical protein DLM54_09520 [Acidimicrobiales bacterium]|uniref:Peptidase M48 domain-containing protein n=1 Tax=Candidatus Aeolococcus gillhamiae TaxID=3127015 RepID=A0A2W5Z0G6_9BACT|nr:MAG: hypothetical protein DLM65_12405 [Candidatus Dormibacter sp. RRmetagenome_bin12]PZS17488.1 MAG: hypothetical protein DLM54_09520 [Acidimicrobiales bacterium]
MILVVMLGGAGLLALPGRARRWGRHLPPQDWSRLAALSLVLGGLALEAALAITALPAVLGAAHGSALAAACSRALGPLAPRGGPVVGWTATGLLAWTLVARRRAWNGARRSEHLGRIEPWLGRHRRFDGWELVILPSDRMFALSVAGRPAQVVISQGLADTLPPSHLDAVVAHERSHLDHHHDRYLRLAAVVSRAFSLSPGTGASSVALRAGLERWSDEDAAAAGDRRCVGQALIDVCYAQVSEDLAAFGAAATTLERIQALEAPPPTRSLRPALAVCLPMVGLVVASLGALATQGAQLGPLAVLLSRCMPA